MDFHKPRSLTEALQAKADNPDMLPVAGGTDVMVELNFDRHRPAGLLDISDLPELRTWWHEGEGIRLGAGVSYSRVIDELAGTLPGLTMASRTVGSPQIRNRGSVGGNLGSASPAGDALPPLLVDDAVVDLASTEGTRSVPVTEFFTGVKRSARRPQELIVAVRIPKPSGPQQFAKVGTRNAMVIAVCSFALSLHPQRGTVAAAIGSAAPTACRTLQAEIFLGEELAERRLWTTRAPMPDQVSRRFGELVADAASPVDDVRGTATYRRRALSVLARRALGWAWHDYGGHEIGRGRSA